MKKNLLFTALAATTLLFATSCQQDEVFVDGNEATVTFEVGTPEIATRAFSQGEKATKLQWAVYDESNTPVVRKENANAQEQHLQGTATLEGGKASVNISLAAGKTYKVLFWADAYGNAEGGAYKVDFDNLKMDVNYEGAVCNDESRDAFFKYVEVAVDQANKTQEVKLTRPFAQLNIGTDDLDKLDGVSAAKTQVKVNVYNQLDLKTGFVTTGATATPQTFTLADRPAETEAFPVNGYKYLAMNYLLVGKDKTVVDVEFSYGAKAETAKTRTYTGIPVQPNYRTNIYGSLLTQGIDFDVTIEPGYDNNDNNTDSQDVIVVNTKEELEAALKQNEKVIRILLGSDVELNLGGDIYNLGGASTDSIIIDGIGTTRSDYRKLTFAKSYMSCLGTVNPDATIIFRNINISGSQEDGTWNLYDISFESNVQLENVTFDKAIALVNDGKTATLKNVTINETHDYYAMWISAAGQTVDIDGLTITAGRGIKIDEQYVDTPAKVTLNVKNATFTTANKAAILVKSVAGADITLENVDIENVAADNGYAVWVDKDAADYDDQVTVKGGLVKVEGDETAPKVINNQADFSTALNNGKDMIYLAAGNYDLSNATIAADNVTIEGLDKENCVVTISEQLRSNNKTLTLKNLTTTVPTGLTYNEYNFAWIHYFKEFNMINCKSDGRIRLNCYSANIEGCEFNVTTSNGFDGYAVYYYGPNESNVTVKNSTFNTVGKAIVMYNEGAPILNLDLEKCTFTSSASTDKAAIQMHTEFGISGTLDITECTATGFADVNGGLWNELNNNTKVPTNKFEITVDGKTLVRTTAQLQKAINAGETEIELYDGTYDAKNFSAHGKTLTLRGKGENTVIYISQDNAVAYGTFDGSNVTFENLTIKTRGGLYKGFARMEGTYKDCTIVNNYFTQHGKHVFEGCTFNAPSDEHCIWTYGATEVDFVNCKFNYSDRGINVYVDNASKTPGITSDVEFTNCEFITTKTTSLGAVEVNSSPFTAGVTVALKDCVAPAYGEMVYVSPWDGTNGATATITVDGNEI